MLKCLNGVQALQIQKKAENLAMQMYMQMSYV